LLGLVIASLVVSGVAAVGTVIALVVARRIYSYTAASGMRDVLVGG
jgi:hypothetical protein